MVAVPAAWLNTLNRADGPRPIAGCQSSSTPFFTTTVQTASLLDELRKYPRNWFSDTVMSAVLGTWAAPLAEMVTVAGVTVNAPNAMSSLLFDGVLQGRQAYLFLR